MNRTCGDTYGKIRRNGGKGLRPSGLHAAPNRSGARSCVPRHDIVRAKVRDGSLDPLRCAHGKKATFVAVMTFVLIVVGGPLLPAQETGLFLLDEKQPILINKRAKEVRLLAELQPQAFAGSLLRRLPGYHALSWKQGKAAAESLLTSLVDDGTFHDAMVSVGGIPGNNLTMAAWNERTNLESSAPDTRVEGTPLHVLVWWPGLRSPLPLNEILVDAAGLGLDLRFGGNKALIPEWRSGCIICLYSCPGAKIGNRAYTIRDYVKTPTNFSVDSSRVPRGNRKALVIVRIKSGASTATRGGAGHLWRD